MTGTEDLINQIGLLSYVGIWFVSLISNVVIPVPEEAVIIVLGYLAAGPKFNGFILLPLVLSALLTSDIIMYFFSRRNNKLVSVFYDKIFASRLESKREWIDKNIDKVVFFSRFLVQLRFLGPFFAGQTGMKFKKFLLLDLGALLVYVPAYLLIGRYFRSRINFIIGGIGVVRNIIIIIGIGIILFALLRYIKNLLLKTKMENSENNKQNDKKI